MSADKEVCRLLDERGIEYMLDQRYREVFWNFGESGRAKASAIGTRRLVQMIATGLTPEQAIEATLGSETCKVDVLNTGDCAGYECSEYIMHCNGCGHKFGYVLYNEDGDV